MVINGLNTYFWRNLWCSKEPLLEEEIAVQCIDLPSNTRVADLIEEGRWNQRVYQMLEQIRDCILTIQIDNLLENDYVWTPNPEGSFTNRSAYRALSKIKPTWRLSKIIWGGWTHPKHSFLAWQVCIDVLNTQDRLGNIEILDHSCCYFAKEKMRTRGTYISIVITQKKCGVQSKQRCVCQLQ